LWLLQLYLHRWLEVVSLSHTAVNNDEPLFRVLVAKLMPLLQTQVVKSVVVDAFNACNAQESLLMLHIRYRMGMQCPCCAQ
jgi:hypothetical protein